MNTNHLVGLLCAALGALALPPALAQDTAAGDLSREKGWRVSIKRPID